jgi:hypothetical protein
MLTFVVLGFFMLKDGIILNDGRKLSGRVVEKPNGYEVTVEGQTLSFPKEEVRRWIKTPREILGDADEQYEAAKKIYQEAVLLKDEKVAESGFREALPKVARARDAYVEARDLFTDGYPELNSRLIDVMTLLRLVRERIGSRIASSEPPVKAAVTPLPPKPLPAVTITVTMSDALAILVDPVRRADEAQRIQARALFWEASATSDVATAGYLFLSRDDEDWQLLTDVVTVGGTLYKGRLEKESDAVSWLTLPDRRKVRLRTAVDGIHVTAPGGVEIKAVDCKIEADQKSESFEILQAFFKGLERIDADSVNLLATKVKAFHEKNIPANVLELFVAGSASALIAKSNGKPSSGIEAAFKGMGYEKSEFGAVWGRKEGLAMDDYRKWILSGDYGMGVVQFQRDYRGVNDVGVRYALGLLMIFKALGDNRNYRKAAVYFEGDGPASARDHFLALAKSIRAEAPCYLCSGAHKVNCATCKGKTRLNLQCGKCGGSGQINSLRSGITTCNGCNGAGRFNNVECPKCKAVGKVDCKARGCTKEVPKPTFESFAETTTCSFCQGRGSLMRHVAYPCPECAGVGLILAPKADPAKLLKKVPQ